ncbi:hypothetical protein BDV18DRAFT_125937 [Aspergillus unguis]
MVREIVYSVCFLSLKIALSDSVFSQLRAGLGEAYLGSFQGELTSSHSGTTCGETRESENTARDRQGKQGADKNTYFNDGKTSKRLGRRLQPPVEKESS